MIIVKPVLWFKTIRYVLEPWPDITALKKKYSAIYILSYYHREMKGWHIKHKQTPVIDLSQPMDNIFKNFNHTTRNEIRRTFDHKIPGLDIKVDDQDIKANYNLSKQFEYKQGRVPETITTYQGCKFFAAYYNNKIISSVICFDSPPVLRAKAICSLRLKTKNKQLYKIISYSTRRLIYEAIKYAHKNNYQRFDLGSVNFNKKNLAQFKMGFTQNLDDEYTYTYMSPLFKALKQAVGLKKTVKKIFKL